MSPCPEKEAGKGSAKVPDEMRCEQVPLSAQGPDLGNQAQAYMLEEVLSRCLIELFKMPCYYVEGG